MPPPRTADVWLPAVVCVGKRTFQAFLQCGSVPFNSFDVLGNRPLHSLKQKRFQTINNPLGDWLGYFLNWPADFSNRWSMSFSSLCPVWLFAGAPTGMRCLACTCWESWRSIVPGRKAQFPSLLFFPTPQPWSPAGDTSTKTWIAVSRVSCLRKSWNNVRKYLWKENAPPQTKVYLLYSTPPTADMPYELKRAHELNALLGPKGSQEAVDLLCDIHNTTSNMGLCLIFYSSDWIPLHILKYIQVINCSARVTLWQQCLQDQDLEKLVFLLHSHQAAVTHILESHHQQIHCLRHEWNSCRFL